MRREGWATTIALLSSVALTVVGDPARSAWIWAGGMVVWGLAVVAILGSGGPIWGGRKGERLEAKAPKTGLGWPALVAAAAAVRVPLLFVSPTLSDDVHRYVWEGRVWLAGFSPFAFTPNDPALLSLRDENWALVNHRDVSSIYPPAAQLLFLVLSPGGVLAFRVFMAACDVGTVAVLFGKAPRLGWIWALLPLCVVEGAVSGHLESAGVLAVAVSLTRTGAISAGAAWVGAMFKLLPGVLLVRQSPKTWVVAGLLSVLAILPMVGPGVTRGFETYRAHWSYNGSIFPLLVALGGDAGVVRRGLQVLGAAVVIWAVVRFKSPVRVALWTFGAFVAVSPTVHPWYGLWPLVAALLAGVRAWTMLAVLLPGAYVVLATLNAGTGEWTEPTWVRPAIYLPFYAVLVRDAWVRVRFGGGE